MGSDSHWHVMGASLQFFLLDHLMRKALDASWVSSEIQMKIIGMESKSKICKDASGSSRQEQQQMRLLIMGKSLQYTLLTDLRRQIASKRPE